MVLSFVQGTSNFQGQAKAECAGTAEIIFLFRGNCTECSDIQLNQFGVGNEPNLSDGHTFRMTCSCEQIIFKITATGKYLRSIIIISLVIES